MLHVKDSFELYKFLVKKDLLRDAPSLWWPKSGTFQVVVGAVLTQNTTWKNVEKSLNNLDAYLELDTFLTLEEVSLKVLIKPSGFYNQKAPRLLQIAKNIRTKYKNFQNFQKNVSREWLLEQKGIGEESADAILCYACFRDEMVVDTYTKRLLKSFDIEFKRYSDYKEFLEKGIRKHFKQEELAKVFAIFHGMIVEYNKLKSFH